MKLSELPTYIKNEAGDFVSIKATNKTNQTTLFIRVLIEAQGVILEKFMSYPIFNHLNHGIQEIMIDQTKKREEQFQNQQ